MSRPATGAAGLRGDPRPLTPREKELLRLVGAGYRDQQIADRVYLSKNTVRRHLSNIYEKLDACSRTEAVATAVRQGII